MADFMLRDRPLELWHQIEDLHLAYVQTEDVPEKFDVRKKLEGIIGEFLCLVPHNRKFRFRETASILHRSATSKSDFNGYGAASAWDCLALYACNVLSQPWRKEFRELELYCGFYKHEIEANLLDADVILQEMGYKHTGQMTMVMDWPLDPDRVSSVSRDSLVAFVECQLMKKIWEDLSLHYPCGWLEVLEFRENHVGSCDQAVQGLLYRCHQRQYQQQQQLAYQQQDVYGSARFHPQPGGCMYGQVAPMPHINYCNYDPYTMLPNLGYSVPVQGRYTTPLVQPIQPITYATPSPIHPPYSHLPQPVIKPHDMYPTNEHRPYNYSSTLGVSQHQLPVQNGYSVSNHMHVGSQPMHSVPTAQLIELDATTPPPSSGSDNQQINSATDSSSSMLNPRAVRQAQIKKGAVVERQPPEKSKDDGTGTFGNWDYVYRNLESQGYSKDLGERPDILSPYDRKSSATLPNPNKAVPYKPSVQDLEEALMQMRLEECQRKGMSNFTERRPMKFDEANKIRLEGDGEPSRSVKRNSDMIDGGESVYDNMSSPPKEKPFTIVPSKTSSVNRSNKASTKTLPREPSRHSERREIAYSSSTLDPRKLTDRVKRRQTTNSIAPGDVNEYKKSYECVEVSNQSSGRGNQRDTPDDPVARKGESSEGNTNSPWECVTCTFLNASPLDVCQMCGKSKNRGPETRPLASGGRECPQCTLVNEKGVALCEACDCNLKDSPTYI